MYTCKINKNNKPLNTPLHLLGLYSPIMFGISEWQIKRRRRRSILFLLDIYYSQKKNEIKSAKIKCFFRFSIAINVQPKFENK
jgi:hypothetical protein